MNLSEALNVSFNNFKLKILEPSFCQKFLNGDEFIYEEIVNCFNKKSDAYYEIEDIVLKIQQIAPKSSFLVQLLSPINQIIQMIKMINCANLDIKIKEIEDKRKNGEFDPPIYDTEKLDSIEKIYTNKIPKLYNFNDEKIKKYNTPSLTRCINFFIANWEAKYYSKHLLVKHKNKLYTNRHVNVDNTNFKYINDFNEDSDIYKVEPDQDIKNVVWTLALKEDIDQFYKYCKEHYYEILCNRLQELNYFSKFKTNKETCELYEYSNSSNEFSNNLIDNIIDNLSDEHIDLLLFKLKSSKQLQNNSLSLN